MASIKMHWESGTSKGRNRITKNVEELDDRIRKVITGEFMYAADDAVTYAKLNAPWTDDTGAARSGLNADAKVSGFNKNHWELIVAHTVHYGIYLEVCNNAKYAIIMPTIKYIGPILLKRMEHALDRLRNEAA